MTLAHRFSWSNKFWILSGVALALATPGRGAMPQDVRVDARAVVDEDPGADSRCRVDVDAECFGDAILKVSRQPAPALLP